MEKYDLNKDFPTEKEWLAMCSPREIEAFFYGGCCYDLETNEGKRVFTLRAARKYTPEQLFCIQEYMIMSDSVDILNTGKGCISFNNILKVEKERTPPPTKEEKEETERSLLRFKKAHPEFFGEIEEDV